MSWSDPCSNCGEHRADCTCGNWNNHQQMVHTPEEKLTQEQKDAICAREGHKFMCPIVCFCTVCGLSDDY